MPSVTFGTHQNMQKPTEAVTASVARRTRAQDTRSTRSPSTIRAAISKVAQAAPDSKDTLKTLRIAHVAALKGSRYRVLDEDGYDALAPAVGGVLPALVDDLSEKSRRDRGAGVTRNLQVVAEAATGAVQRWIQLNDEATARIMKREEHIEWLRKLFTGWKEARPALRESQRRDNAGNAGTGQQPVGRTRAATAAQAGGSGDSGQRVGETDGAPLTYGALRERFRAVAACWARGGLHPKASSDHPETE